MSDTTTRPATIGDTDRAARNLFGAMLTLYGGQAFPEDVAAEVNRLIGRFAYEGGLSANQIDGMRERMTDALAETVADLQDINIDICLDQPDEDPEAKDLPGSAKAAALAHHAIDLALGRSRLPLAILGNGDYASVIEEAAVRG